MFAPNDKFSNKNGHLSTWRDFKKILCYVCRYDKRHFKPKISSIFHFVLVNDGWISHILYYFFDILPRLLPSAGCGATPFLFRDSLDFAIDWIPVVGLPDFDLELVLVEEVEELLLPLLLEDSRSSSNDGNCFNTWQNSLIFLKKKEAKLKLCT